MLAILRNDLNNISMVLFLKRKLCSCIAHLKYVQLLFFCLKILVN